MHNAKGKNDLRYLAACSKSRVARLTIAFYTLHSGRNRSYKPPSLHEGASLRPLGHLESRA